MANEFLVGNARDLRCSVAGAFDGILALGPLYHITEGPQRIAFLKVARSLLAPGGILIAAYLNAWGIARSLLSDASWWFGTDENVDCLLAGGISPAHAPARGSLNALGPLRTTPRRSRVRLDSALLTKLGLKDLPPDCATKSLPLRKQTPQCSSELSLLPFAPAGCRSIGARRTT